MDEHIASDNDSRAELSSYPESEEGTLNAHNVYDSSTLTLSQEQNNDHEDITSDIKNCHSADKFTKTNEENDNNPDTSENLHDEIDNNEEEEDDDPLHIRTLALNFDYLMYKIRDHTTLLSDAVVQNVDYAKRQQELELSKINRRIREARKLIIECKRTDMEIDKLEQFKLLTRDFKHRLEEVNRRMDAHTKRYKK